jgi:hypothetical protein
MTACHLPASTIPDEPRPLAVGAHHDPGLFSCRSGMITRTAAVVGEQPIGGALWPEVLVGSGSCSRRVCVGECLVCLQLRDLVPVGMVSSPCCESTSNRNASARWRTPQPPARRRRRSCEAAW